MIKQSAQVGWPAGYCVPSFRPTWLCLIICTINLPDAATLGGAHDVGGTSAVGLYTIHDHVICCSGRIGLRQQRRRRRLFVVKAEVAA